MKPRPSRSGVTKWREWLVASLCGDATACRQSAKPLRRRERRRVSKEPQAISVLRIRRIALSLLLVALFATSLSSAQASNVTLQQTNGTCIAAGGWISKCSFHVDVINNGPRTLSDSRVPISFFDRLPDGTTFAGISGDGQWRCVPSGSEGIACTHSRVILAAHGRVSVDLYFDIPKDVAAAKGCRVTNGAIITAPPVGSVLNTIRADDSSSATDRVPEGQCVSRRLTIDTTASQCSLDRRTSFTHFSVKCQYQVDISYSGSTPYHGPIEFLDIVPPGVDAQIDSVSSDDIWSCFRVRLGLSCQYRHVTSPTSAGDTATVESGGRLEARVTFRFSPWGAFNYGCKLKNKAQLIYPPRLSDRGLEPGGIPISYGPAAEATADVSGDLCHQAPLYNLIINKGNGNCSKNTGSNSFTCRFLVQVRSDPDYAGNVFDDQIVIVDHPASGTWVHLHPIRSPYADPDYSPPPEDLVWHCVSSGDGSQTCTHPRSIFDYKEFYLNAEVEVPGPVMRSSNCLIGNGIEIAYPPFGARDNQYGFDDHDGGWGRDTDACQHQSSTTTTHAHRRKRQIRSVRKCRSGYEFKNGACKLKPQPTMQSHQCPVGTAGKWPSCKLIAHSQACPSGTVRRGRKCITTQNRKCSKGTIGKWPSCKQVAHHRPCPKGTVRHGRRCVAVLHRCPKGTIGRWPKCQRRTCAKGMVGRWPKCHRIKLQHPQPLHGQQLQPLLHRRFAVPMRQR